MKQWIKMKNYSTLLFCLLLCSCNTANFYKNAQNGDLIFVEAKQENLSGAISRVTSQNNKLSFDHIGLINVENNKKFVLHSSTENGSVRESFKKFTKRFYTNKRTQEIYRLKTEYQKCIPNAINNAKTMLGKPYNFSYILNEDSYYCSDFVERAFRDCKIFELKPMTFINPETNKTDEYWVAFYSKINIKVPEGKLGCNPNGLANSEKIEKVTSLKPKK